MSRQGMELNKEVIVVDDDDNALFFEDKLLAHEKGLLHRAFSVMVYREGANGYEFLIQRRDWGKYHSSGLLSNTCCSHPSPNEDTLCAAKRRLFEELGFSCELIKVGVFKYKAEFDNGLSEHEIDHVFIGRLDNQKINPDPSEVCEVLWMSEQEINARLDEFTFWFKQVFDLVLESLLNGLNKSEEKVKFSSLNWEQRIKFIEDCGLLEKSKLEQLKKQSLENIGLAESLVENAIGVFEMPLGMAVNVVINEKEYLVPMAVEESSVIAACCKSASWIRKNGYITGETIGNCYLGQILIYEVQSIESIKKLLELEKASLIEKANQAISQSMIERGGGVKDIRIRSLSEDMASIDVYVDTKNAMGANCINQICEILKAPVVELLGVKVNLCIVSNLSDSKLTSVKVFVRNVDEQLGCAIERASKFAEIDPYRATTSNKGVANGMDAVALATGNDWRALNAGMHAYAASSGRYKSITKWRYTKGELVGEIKTPLQVGTVGGITKVHSMANLALTLLNVESSDELAQVIAAIGLIQNLAAIRALVSDGIVKGHMKLHIDTMLYKLEQPQEILRLVKEELHKKLSESGYISDKDVDEVLSKFK